MSPRGFLFLVVVVGVLGLPGSRVLGSGAPGNVGRHLVNEEDRKCTKEQEEVCRDVEEKQCSGAKKEKCFQVPVEDCGPQNTQNCWMETKRGCTKPQAQQCRKVRRQECGSQPVGSECRTVIQNRCRTIPRESCPPVEECKLVRKGGCNGKKLLTSIGRRTWKKTSSHKKKKGSSHPRPPPPPPPPPPTPPPPPPPAPPAQPAPRPTPAPQGGGGDDDGDDDDGDDDGDDDDGGDSPGTSFHVNIKPRNPFVLQRRENPGENPRVLGSFLDCDARWERECQQVPAFSDCQDCGPTEEVVCEDQSPSSDCQIVEEEVCESVEEQCEDIQVQRCENLRTDACKTVMKEECRPMGDDDDGDDDDDDNCEIKIVKKCQMEERERCVLGVSAFEHAIQSVNVKLAAEFVEGNKDPVVIADALSVKPEEKEQKFRKTPERVGDPDVIVGKAFAKAVLDSENTQVIADKLAKVAIETVIRDVWKVQFFVDLKQLERNLRTIYADRTAMEAVSNANPAQDLLPRTVNSGRKLKCVNCTPLHSLMCAHCWPINVCGEFWWCKAQ